MSYLRLSIIIVLSIFASISFAQEITPEATEEAIVDDIELTIFTLAEPEINGIYPDTWNAVQLGSYVNPDDNTSYLLHFASIDTPLDELLQPLLDAFLQETLPAESESYEAQEFIWELYTFEYKPSEDDDTSLHVDIATMETNTLVLIIVLQSTAEAYETFHADVFLPAVDNFGQSLEDIEANLNLDDMVATNIDVFGIDTAIPRDWENVNQGSYVRGDIQVDPTTLIIQTSPDLSETEFRNLFAERLNISVTEDAEEYSSDILEWEIYSVDIEIEGILLTWQIATANDEKFSYLVVLFSFTDEAEGLKESVLLPVLDATQATQ